MATSKHTFTGTSYWAKVFESNRDMKGFEDAYAAWDGMYTIDVMLDKDNKNLLKASGSAKKGKFDDDGNFIVKFTRKHKDRFEWASGAPEVVKADGTPWDFSTDGFLPNGSKVQVEVTVYTTSKVPGTRLEKIVVLEKAEMEERPTKADESEAAPPKTFKPNSEIPF